MDIYLFIRPNPRLLARRIRHRAAFLVSTTRVQKGHDLADDEHDCLGNDDKELDFVHIHWNIYYYVGFWHAGTPGTLFWKVSLVFFSWGNFCMSVPYRASVPLGEDHQDRFKNFVCLPPSYFSSEADITNFTILDNRKFHLAPHLQILKITSAKKAKTSKLEGKMEEISHCIQ